MLRDHHPALSYSKQNTTQLLVRQHDAYCVNGLFLMCLLPFDNASNDASTSLSSALAAG